MNEAVSALAFLRRLCLILNRTRSFETYSSRTRLNQHASFDSQMDQDEESDLLGTFLLPRHPLNLDG